MCFLHFKFFDTGFVFLKAVIILIPAFIQFIPAVFDVLLCIRQFLLGIFQFLFGICDFLVEFLQAVPVLSLTVGDFFFRIRDFLSGVSQFPLLRFNALRQFLFGVIKLLGGFIHDFVVTSHGTNISQSLHILTVDFDSVLIFIIERRYALRSRHQQMNIGVDIFLKAKMLLRNENKSIHHSVTNGADTSVCVQIIRRFHNTHNRVFCTVDHIAEFAVAVRTEANGIADGKALRCFFTAFHQTLALFLRQTSLFQCGTIHPIFIVKISIQRQGVEFHHRVGAFLQICKNFC